MVINTWFHVIQISIFSLLRTRLSTIWEKYISSYLLISKRKGVVTKNPLLQFDKRYCHAFENIYVCSTVYTCSALFVTFTFFFFRRLFWKRETIPCAVHELINLKAIEMLQRFADILIDILIPLKLSWLSRSSFSWSIVLDQHIVDSSDLLT